MHSLLLAVLLAVATPQEVDSCRNACVAATKSPDCQVTVSCKVKKPVVKKKKVLASPGTPPIPEKVPEKVVVAPVEPEPEPTPTPAPPAPKSPPRAKGSGLTAGLHLGLGLGVVNAAAGPGAVSGMVGFRIHHRPSRLGFEMYSALDKGVGLELMVWTYQGKKLSHHIDAGVLLTGGYGALIAVNDVPRDVDVTFGTGIEIPVFKRVDFTVDWKLRIPDPSYLATHNSPVYSDGQQVYGEAGKYLDIKHVLGNSLTQSQVFFGILIHE